MIHSAECGLEARGLSLLSDPSKQILRQVLKALPADQRIAFLREVLDSLTVEERIAVLRRHKAQSENPEPRIPPPKHEEKTPKTPTPLSQPALVNPVPSVEAPATQRQAMLESEFENFTAFSEAAKKNSAAELKRQVVGCLGLAILGGAVFVVLSVLGKNIWDWLWSVI